MSNSDDKKYVDTILKAAELGSVDALNEMGNICNRWNNYAESMYWYAMANAYGHPDGDISILGIAKKWKAAGCPRQYEKGTEKFTEAHFECALAYLEMNAGEELTVSLDNIVQYNLNGLPIAAYLAGDIFESIGNVEMAYKMYNAIAFENDPHGLRCYADMLYTGRGIPKNVQGAVHAYQMAAERGDREAMFIVGELTKASNKNLAAYWFGLSHTRGYQNALPRLIQLSKS